MEKIIVLGGGCARCHEMLGNAKAALAEMNQPDIAELVTDYGVIASYGVMSLPALAIDDRLVSYGKVLKKDEIIEIIKKEG